MAVEKVRHDVHVMSALRTNTSVCIWRILLKKAVSVNWHECAALIHSGH